MNRERLLESLHRFRDFLIKYDRNQIDLWPLANAITYIAATPDPETIVHSDGVRMCAEWLTEAGHAELAGKLLASQAPAPPPPPGSVKVRIAVIRYLSGGGQFVECDVIYDDPKEVMEALESHVWDGNVTHKAIVSVAIPAFMVTPIVAGTVEAIDDPEATA